ncbi:carbohydrate sulfotransferase 10-like [Macrobrachium nipponense]|uniref:carbohydrate sulfotransferase 10-like n=1 Tax=Macrobrachium nipponense TaxID=159736 RepID=UPI0030C80D43
MKRNMFAFRVKHLLLVCLLTSLFLYYTSNPKINEIPTEPETGNGHPKYEALHKKDDHPHDVIDNFIDTFVNDDFKINIKPAASSTDQSLFYVGENETGASTEDEYDEDSYDSDEEVRGAAHDGYDYDNRPRQSAKANNVYNEDTFSSLKEVAVSTASSKRKDGINHKNVHPRPSNPKEKIIIKQKTATPVGIARNVQGSPKVIAPPTVTPLGTNDPPQLAPLINKERQNQIHKESPIVVLPRDSYWPPVLQPSNARIFSEINYTRYNPEDRKYLSGRVGVYEERARTVSEVCRNHPDLITATPVHNFVWDRLHDPNIVWCEISKVASTSWMVNFLRLGHYRENDTTLAGFSEKERDAIRFETRLKDSNLHFRVLRLFPAPNTTKERFEVFSKALRFIIVRDPFTRLLSAYQDKMTTLNPLPIIYKFRQLQIDIIERYRGNKTIPNNHDPNFPTFEEFVQYVIDSTADLKTLKDWKKVICWQPYWTKCGVCAHDFQMIMKTETMEEDERFLVKLANLHELDKVHEWRHSKKSDIEKEEFFKQLSTEQVHSLYQRYHLDFLLFGYSIDKYLELAYDVQKQND